MEIRVVTPAYFAAMRIPVERGRPFAKTDSEAAPGVILVNQTLARQWWGAENPMGDSVVVGKYQGKDVLGLSEAPRAVVGIVADTKTEFLTAPAKPTVYIPAAQAAWYSSGMAWVVRSGPSVPLSGALRQAIAEIDPRQRVRRMRAMEDIVAGATSESRFDAWLFGSFAALALALTVIGIYGLLAFSVARRTSEFGMRMALGATRWDVLKMVLGQGAALIAAGLVIGLGGAFEIARSLRSLLYGVKPADPLSFAAVALVLLAAGLAASYLPARRATRVDPIVALRYE
jgi:putative ABC transport system permease protein